MVDVEDKEQDSWVEELSSLLVKAETQPNDIEMLKRQLVLLDSLSMTEEYLEAADHLSSLIMLDTSELRPFPLPGTRSCSDNRRLDRLFRQGTFDRCFAGRLYIHP